jgi:hypothetical protein
VRSHGPVSFPCNLHPLPESHFPGSKLLCTSPLCLPHLFIPFVLGHYSVTPPVRPFLPCSVPRVPAFPSVVPNAFHPGPSSFGFGPANQRTACKYRISQVQSVSFEEAPVIDIIPRLDRNFLLRWTHFKLPVDWPILQPVCCPSDTRQTHLRNWSRASLSRLFTHRPLPSASADGRHCS